VGKNKIRKFADLNEFKNVLQVPFRDIFHHDHALRGKWNAEIFKNDQPIVLELGCGKGEYTVGLAKIDGAKNYVGVDIKGSRMWDGAKSALDMGLDNVAFLRMHIEMMNRFFAPGEVSEIWLTFPDPQMKRSKKRLTSALFLDRYRKFLKPGGIIHLKTDSNFFYHYTLEVINANGFEILSNIDDVYAPESVSPMLQIRTYYEKQWLGRGLNIKYISFIPHQKELIEPDVEIKLDTYRSFGRGVVEYK
jgi:tRNA (guanine-N7-)-methyltransferase